MNLPKVRGSYRKDFNLANVTWFGVGGMADYLFKPADIEDLSFFLKNKPENLEYIILGVGSNLLVRDGGFRGVVIRLGKGFTEILHNENELIVGAGALDINVSKYCAENGISGFEFLSGIPGVIGAAIAMNAGAYGKETADILIKAEAVDRCGNIVFFNNNDLGFKYRSNSLSDDYIFTKAYFKVEFGNKEDIWNKINQIQTQREETQPIRSKTSGSSFKNPVGGYKAWELIDKAGCRGIRLGGAEISTKHCNFLINTGDATAQDIEDLGESVRKKVFENSNIWLDWEIKIIGVK